jgi:hypothetical protein
VTQTGGSGARLEALLAAQRLFVFEQNTELFGMFESVRLSVLFKHLVALGHAVQAKLVQ